MGVSAKNNHLYSLGVEWAQRLLAKDLGLSSSAARDRAYQPEVRSLWAWPPRSY